MAVPVELPGFATSPFFITADMLQPPWADPMAVLSFNKYLVGMGLKTGSVMEEGEAAAIEASLPDNIKINPEMSLATGLGNMSKDMGKAVKKKAVSFKKGVRNVGAGVSESIGNSIGKTKAYNSMRETMAGGPEKLAAKDAAAAIKKEQHAAKKATKKQAKTDAKAAKAAAKAAEAEQALAHAEGSAAALEKELNPPERPPNEAELAEMTEKQEAIQTELENNQIEIENLPEGHPKLVKLKKKELALKKEHSNLDTAKTKPIKPEPPTGAKLQELQTKKMKLDKEVAYQTNAANYHNGIKQEMGMKTAELDSQITHAEMNIAKHAEKAGEGGYSDVVAKARKQVQEHQEMNSKQIKIAEAKAADIHAELQKNPNDRALQQQLKHATTEHARLKEELPKREANQKALKESIVQHEKQLIEDHAEVNKIHDAELTKVDEAIKDPATYLAQKQKVLEAAELNSKEVAMWGKGASVEEIQHAERKLLAAQKGMEEAEHYKQHKENIDNLNQAGRELEAAKKLHDETYADLPDNDTRKIEAKKDLKQKEKNVNKKTKELNNSEITINKKRKEIETNRENALKKKTELSEGGKSGLKVNSVSKAPDIKFDKEKIIQDSAKHMEMKKQNLSNLQEQHSLATEMMNDKLDKRQKLQTIKDRLEDLNNKDDRQNTDEDDDDNVVGLTKKEIAERKSLQEQLKKAQVEKEQADKVYETNKDYITKAHKELKNANKEVEEATKFHEIHKQKGGKKTQRTLS